MGPWHAQRCTEEAHVRVPHGVMVQIAMCVHADAQGQDPRPEVQSCGETFTLVRDLPRGQELPRSGDVCTVLVSDALVVKHP